MATIIRLPGVEPFDYDRLSDERKLEIEPVLAQWAELVQANPLWGFQPFGTKGLRYEGRKAALAAIDAGERSTPNQGRGAQISFLAAGRIKTKMGAAGNQAGKCLDADELVLMADGSVRAIKDIAPGDFVLGVDLDGSTRPARVLRHIDQGVKDVYRHSWSKRGARASFAATLEHKMLARPESGENRIVPVGETGARWVAQRTLGYEPTGATDEPHASLIGLLLGDGCLTGQTPSFTCDDPDILALMRKGAERIGCHLLQNAANPIQYQITKPQRGSAPNPVKELAREHGFDCYAHEKHLPDVSRWSNASVGELLAGLILTDGSVGERDVSFCSTSWDLVDGLRSLMEERFGVYGSKTMVNEREGRRTEYAWRVANHAGLVRLASSIPLVGRKQLRLDTMLAEWGGKHSDGAGLVFAESVYLGRRQTFDITIDHPTHLFALANGLVVSNTEIGVLDNIIQCVDRECVPPWLSDFKFWEPPFLLRVVTMDLGNSLYGVMLPKWQRLVPKDQLEGGTWKSAFDKTLRVLRFKNGSMVQFLSAEQEREKHQGATLDRIHFDEEPPPPNGQAIYEESRMRVMARSGQLMFTMTPLLGLSWTYDELWESEDPSVFKVKWSLLDNPHIADSDVRGEIARMPTDAIYHSRVGGDFTAFRGRVLEEFDREAHIVQPPKRAQIADMDVLIGYDPGLSRGGVVWVAFDKDYHALVFDELYPSGLGVPAIAKLIREKNALWGLADPLLIVDPASRIRDMSTAAETVQSALEREGFSVVPGQNDRLAGVLEMKARLDSGALLVSSACTNWLREQDRWLIAADEETQENRPRSTAKGSSIATIGPDHLMDPTRYALMERLWVPPAELPKSTPDRFKPDHAPNLSRFRAPQEARPLGFLS